MDKFETLRQFIIEDRKMIEDYIKDTPKNKELKRLYNQAVMMGLDHALNLMDVVDGKRGRGLVNLK